MQQEESPKKVDLSQVLNCPPRFVRLAENFRDEQSLAEISKKPKDDINSEFEVKYSLIKILERMKPNLELLDQ